MYVSRVKLRNWRNFADADIDFRETVYIIGPNASGKSNLLDIFRFMRDIVNPMGGGLQQALATRGGLAKTRCLAARRNSNIEFEFEFKESFEDPQSEPIWRYILCIDSEKQGKHRPIISKEEVYKDGKQLFVRPDKDDQNDPQRLTQTHLEQINMNQQFREIASFFEQVLYLHLVPQLLKFNNQLSSRLIEHDPFGQAFLKEIASTPEKTRKSRLDRIEKTLQKVIPNFEELHFEKDDVGLPHLIMRCKHWRPNAEWQNEEQFSDGTLRMIAILWSLLTPNNMILLEEPELSLHKRIVEQIPDLIHAARQSRKKAGGQIIISTHSEAMLAGKSITGNFLILKPDLHGEGTTVGRPSEDDEKAMRAGLSPADALLPQTATTIQEI